MFSTTSFSVYLSRLGHLSVRASQKRTTPPGGSNVTQSGNASSPHVFLSFLFFLFCYLSLSLSVVCCFSLSFSPIGPSIMMMTFKIFIGRRDCDLRDLSLVIICCLADFLYLN